MTRLSLIPLIHPTASITDATFGRYTEVAERCVIQSATVDDYSYLMRECEVWAAKIGKFANIASHVRINAPNHPTWRPTLHHFTYRSDDYWPDADRDEAFFGWRKDNAVTIGHDVWIGHGATILPGVTIGNGAAIGAGAVVTRDVAPYAIFGGVAAKLIRHRFSPPIIERLERLKWWDWSHERLRDALPDFRNLAIDDFLSRYEHAQ